MVPVLVWSMRDETVYARRALEAGAAGYVEKSASGAEVVAAIRTVADGGTYLSQRMTDFLLRLATGVPVTSAGGAAELLSPRELEVFELIGRGLSTREIAEQLGCGTTTVYGYRDAIKDKLEVATNAELIRRAALWMAGQE